MIVQGGLPANFNYAAFDQDNSLFVAASVYDVTTGAAVFVSKIPMALKSAGVYAGSFTPVRGKSYLVISVCYTDGTYATVDSTRAPAADQYDAFASDSSLLNFNYACFDQDTGQTVSAVVYNLTDATQANVSMTHVAFGVYFGHYQGVIGKSYLAVKTTTDPNRAPGADSLVAMSLPVYELTSATLEGQDLDPMVLKGQSLVGVLTGEC